MALLALLESPRAPPGPGDDENQGSSRRKSPQPAGFAVSVLRATQGCAHGSG